MSLLPTTRISNGVGDSSIPGQDEDILLVDFQPVVVTSCNQVMSSPSTATPTPMYPIPPPGSLLPGAHMSGGVRLKLPVSSAPPHTATATAVTQANLPYDENDEFAKHQALAQPTYMMNKRRSRRFVSRDNHMWDNSNHVGHHHQQPQPHMSSSLSSSEDSDTGFLMGTRKTAYTRRSVQRVVDPHPTTTTVGGNGSPSASTGLLPNLGNRKRVRRRRPSARNRKPVNNQRDKIPNPGDVLSFCCCLCDDDQPSHSSNRSSNASSFKNRYFRLACLVVIIIVIAVLASITVSLQRKVESLDGDLKRLDQAVGSPLSSDSSNGAKTPKPTESFETLLAAHNALNTTVTNLKAQLDQISGKLQDLQKQLNAAASKPDGVTEVRGDLAKLGSRVQELSSIVQEKLKDAAQNAIAKENESANAAKPTASST
ncbi:C-Jun-amino-terminal kinase-interacting protein 3 [Orchesella cincta]|uniref:C-Jun-amino-terminal kinase-interacting protein 3 n=1 Tax=Orchesella cincta TaxID=48709 RepID=A0A1D2M571_ORCCI|nr:C-Jun-amino-terminal kinase-interacting protein 3 [Orchesella cincta]